MSCCALTPSEVLGDKNTFFGESGEIGTTKSNDSKTHSPTHSLDLVWRTNTIIPAAWLLTCCFRINWIFLWLQKFRFAPLHSSSSFSSSSEAVFLFPLRWPSGPDCRRQRSALQTHTHSQTRTSKKLFQHRLHRPPFPVLCGVFRYR